jgi:hypothetical protein
MFKTKLFLKASKLMAFILLLSLLIPSFSFGADEDSGAGAGLVDDSIRDFSIVLGTGAAGAVIGLSTLSFVDEPSKHFKNVAVGGAIGIVFGVGYVIFSQASRSTSTIGQVTPMNQDKFISMSKKEFSDYKIAQNYFQVPSFTYQFSF